MKIIIVNGSARKRNTLTAIVKKYMEVIYED